MLLPPGSPVIPSEWEMGDSTGTETFPEKVNPNALDPGVRKLLRDDSDVPNEWRRASIGDIDPSLIKRKDSTPQEWRRASVQVGPKTEHDVRERRPADFFLREEEKVKVRLVKN